MIAFSALCQNQFAIFINNLKWSTHQFYTIWSWKLVMQWLNGFNVFLAILQPYGIMCCNEWYTLGMLQAGRTPRRGVCHSLSVRGIAYGDCSRHCEELVSIIDWCSFEYNCHSSKIHDIKFHRLFQQFIAKLIIIFVDSKKTSLTFEGVLRFG